MVGHIRANGSTNSLSQEQHHALDIYFARLKFLESLPAILPQSLLKYQEYAFALSPLGNVIQSFRIMHPEGIKLAKVANQFSNILYIAPETVRAKIDNLRQLGLDPVKVVNRQPAVLTYAPA